MSRFDVTNYGRFLGGNRRGRKGAGRRKKLTDRCVSLEPLALGLEPLQPRILLAADVSTDKLDYPPGATASLTATEFQVGESEPEECGRAGTDRAVLFAARRFSPGRKRIGTGLGVGSESNRCPG